MSIAERAVLRQRVSLPGRRGGCQRGKCRGGGHALCDVARSNCVMRHWWRVRVVGSAVVGMRAWRSVVGRRCGGRVRWWVQCRLVALMSCRRNRYSVRSRYAPASLVLQSSLQAQQMKRQCQVRVRSVRVTFCCGRAAVLIDAARAVWQRNGNVAARSEWCIAKPAGRVVELPFLPSF